ncbi:MAG: hypothetical protein MI975_11865 [Cytophagales bacterium]|nr:hypothetical protein [Cytophagales bacterium]
MELLVVVAGLQWVFGAWIAYVSESDHWRYFMYVEEGEYMKLAVPGLICFSIGIFIFYPKLSLQDINVNLQQFVQGNGKIAYWLVIIGLISTYIGPYAPVGFRFVFYLISSFQYAGLALLLFKRNNRSKWLWFVGIMGLLTTSSIIKGMFHDLFLWSVLLSSFVIIQLRLGTSAKILFITLGFLAAILVQSIKSQYRLLASELNEEERIGLFTQLMTEQADNMDVFTEQSSLEMLNVRLNQGWIISSIVYNIPRFEPFAEGETIIKAVQASLLPRFLFPDKKEAGGRENFRRFTGIGIRDDTSMGTSILGEAYANYGFERAWIFMSIWGIIVAWVFRRLMYYGKKRPIIYVFIPLIFLQVIKAETELYVVLNHFVKSLILVFVFLWLARRIFKWQV